MVSDIEYIVTSSPRHFKILFFIDPEYKYLEQLMIRNMELWGGRYNPIIPIFNNTITEEYKKLVKYLDPDYVYYSKKIDLNFIETEFNLNPIKYIPIEENEKPVILGVISNCFLNSSERKMPIPTNIKDIKKPLDNFYKLNFLYESNHYTVFKEDEKAVPSFDNHKYSSINEFYSKNDITFKPLLSQKKLKSFVFTPRNIDSNSFELIISNDDNSLLDLIYFWNRQLYISPNLIGQIIVPKSQLAELISDKFFFQTLKKLANGREISITSKTLDLKKLNNIIKTQLESNELSINFKSIINSFPYEIKDANGFHIDRTQESYTKQSYYRESGLYFSPPLGFELWNNSNQAWAVDLRIKKSEGFDPEQMRFTKRYDTHYSLFLDGRVNKNAELTFKIDNSFEPTEIYFNSFSNYVHEVIRRPIINSIKKSSGYKYSEVNNVGRKLKAFIKLFENDLAEVTNFIFDKFWFNLLIDLSTSNKINGDTIKFNDIIERCLKILELQGVKMMGEGTYLTESNLRKGIRQTLEINCERNIFFIGHEIKCETCMSKYWYSINEVNHEILCKGCNGKQIFPIETAFSYKLNSLVSNNLYSITHDGEIVPDGNITVLKTILSLKQRSRFFEFITQVNIYDKVKSQNPVGDIDILCLMDGRLVIGEAKHNSKEFEKENHEPLKKLVQIANVIKPDIVVIACTIDENDKLGKKKKFIERLINDKSIQIMAILVEDAQYEFDTSYYFPD